MRVFDVPVPEGTVHAIAWDGPAGAETLLFAHATGMCARVYAELLAPLAQRYAVRAFDARGHGRTALPADAAAPPADWEDWGTAAGDMLALMVALGLDTGRTVLAGHSFGGTVAVQAAARLAAGGTPAAGVVAIEPAFIPLAQAAAYGAARAAGAAPPNPLADQAERRRGEFGSVGEMRDAYRGRGVFEHWADAALDAYLAGGAEEGPDGARLLCAPAWEAATFRAVTTRFEEAARAVASSLHVICGTVGSTVRPEDADALAAMGARVTRLDGARHFAPVERPDVVRAAAFG